MPHDPNFDPVLAQRREAATRRRAIESQVYGPGGKPWLFGTGGMFGAPFANRAAEARMRAIEVENPTGFDRTDIEPAGPPASMIRGGPIQAAVPPAAATPAAPPAIESYDPDPFGIEARGGLPGLIPEGSANLFERAGPPTTQIEGAPPPRPRGEIRFKSAGGDGQDLYAGDRFQGERSTSAYDPGRGESVRIRPIEGGGGFTPSARLEDVAFLPESYYEDLARDAEIARLTGEGAIASARGRAETSRARAIEADPFALERFGIEGRIAERVAAERAAAGARGEQNRETREAYQQAVGQLRAQAQAEKARQRETIRDPVLLKTANDEIDLELERMLRNVDTSFGVSERISAAGLYGR